MRNTLPLRALAAACALLAISSVRAETDPKDKKGAADHPAVQRYPGSFIRESYFYNYDELTFPVADKQPKTVTGKVNYVRYEFPRDASCAQVLRNFENAFKGASMQAHRGDSLRSVGLNGGKWASGEGKFKNTPVYMWIDCNDDLGNHTGDLYVVEEGTLDAQQIKLDPTAKGATTARAPKDVAGSRDHPWLARFPGSRLARWDEREFDEVKLWSGERKPDLKVEGRMFRATYEFPEAASCTEIIRNYEAAARTAGLAVELSKDMEHPYRRSPKLAATGTLGGAPFWMNASCNFDRGNHRGDVIVVQGEAMAQKVAITADLMADELGKNGRIALYGVNFEFNKADITADSGQVLDEIGRLLQAHKDWKLRVEGHTDNVGGGKFNLDLSKKRAAAVKEWLVKKNQVDGARLTTDGFGDTKPVVPNDTDENRAKNRRVELVKL